MTKVKTLYCILLVEKTRTASLVERHVDHLGCVHTPVDRLGAITSLIGTLVGANIFGLARQKLGSLDDWFSDPEAKRFEYWTFDKERADLVFATMRPADAFDTLVAGLIPLFPERSPSAKLPN